MDETAYLWGFAEFDHTDYLYSLWYCSSDQRLTIMISDHLWDQLSYSRNARGITVSLAVIGNLDLVSPLYAQRKVQTGRRNNSG